MISKKRLSALIVAVGVAALPAWSAISDGATEAAPDATTPASSQPAERGNAANPLGATSIVNPLEPSPG
jgi:hypothetical protein